MTQNLTPAEYTPKVLRPVHRAPRPYPSGQVPRIGRLRTRLLLERAVGDPIDAQALSPPDDIDHHRHDVGPRLTDRRRRHRPGHAHHGCGDRRIHRHRGVYRARTRLARTGVGVISAFANTRELAPIAAGVAFAAQAGCRMTPRSGRCASPRRSTRSRRSACARWVSWSPPASSPAWCR